VIASNQTMVKTLLLVASLLVMSACASTQTAASGDGESLPREFATVLRNYETAWRKKDAAALANLFAADAYVLPNGAPPVHGRENIRAHYEGAGGPLYLSALAWSRNGGVGYIIGKYSHEPPPSSPRGKFTLTLWGMRQHPDSASYVDWFIKSDMDSSNAQPKPQTSQN
jgi:ketosteroid isomerase-like protein